MALKPDWEKIEEYSSRINSIENLRKFLIEYFSGRDVRVYLFGSRSDGSNTDRSDIDISIFSDTDISKDINYLRYLFEESNLPYRVDLVDAKDIQDEFAQKIIEKGEIWIGAEK